MIKGDSAKVTLKGWCRKLKGTRMRMNRWDRKSRLKMDLKALLIMLKILLMMSKSRIKSSKVIRILSQRKQNKFWNDSKPIKALRKNNSMQNRKSWKLLLIRLCKKFINKLEEFLVECLVDFKLLEDRVQLGRLLKKSIDQLITTFYKYF